MTTKTIRALQVLVIFLGVVIFIMMGVIITVISQRMRAASEPFHNAPWEVQLDGAALLDLDLNGNRAAFTIKQRDGGERVEIYNVLTGELIGIGLRHGVGAAP